MSFIFDLLKTKLTCAATNCKKFALPNSNYCKDHSRGGKSSENDIARAIESKIMERVERTTIKY